jgi:hypothetical protein
MPKALFSTLKLSVLALAVVALTQSCKKSSDLEVPAPAATTTTAAKADNIAELKEAVAASTGHPVSAVTYSATAKEFTVDGDGLVSLEDAQARFANNNAGTASAANGTAQRKYTYMVAATKRNIKIYADATVTATWIAAFDNAIANWNKAGTSITISRVTSATGASTTVSSSYNNATNVIASSYYPDTFGNAGKRISVNTYFDYLSDAQKIFAITHEIGHTLGFTHTNGTYGTLISGTTDSDPSSIMNATCLSWAGFTSNDMTAIKSVY